MSDPLAELRHKGLILKETGVNMAALLPGMEKGKSIKGAKLSEAEFQGQVIAYARLNGWKVAHFRRVRIQRRDGSTYYETPVAADGAGWPDLMMFRGTEKVAAELKVSTTTSPEQEAWLRTLEAAGFLCVIWKPENWGIIVATLKMVA